MLKSRTALLLALPTLALGACGGDSDKDEITKIINDGAKDPTTICENASDKILQQVGGSVEACKKAAAAADDQSDGKPKDLEIKVDGKKATATFKDDAGNNRVGFVKDGDKWKVESTQ